MADADCKRVLHRRGIPHENRPEKSYRATSNAAIYLPDSTPQRFIEMIRWEKYPGPSLTRPPFLSTSASLILFTGRHKRRVKRGRFDANRCIRKERRINKIDDSCRRIIYSYIFHRAPLWRIIRNSEWPSSILNSPHMMFPSSRCIDRVTVFILNYVSAANKQDLNYFDGRKV